MMQKLRIRAGSVGTFHGVTNSVYGSAVIAHALVVSAPAAQGLRVAYDATPAALRAWVDATLGSPVTEAITQVGGFSPGVAVRLRCADGTRAFCKAVSDLNVFAADAHRREQRINAALPVGVPVPRLRAAYDEGGWVALLIDDVDGRQPTVPWDRAELGRVLAAIDELAALLTPCPLPEIPSIVVEWREDFDHWRVAAAGGPPPALNGWARRNLDRLAALEAGWEPAAAGDTLLHMDLRADNLLVTPDRVWVVDWPHATRGAALFDILAMAPSVAMQGGPDPQTLLSLSATGRHADRGRVAALVCALAGYFVLQALQPAPPGLPTVRAFQAAQGETAVRWLAELTGWR
jgi:aminoglycoside phosphotransferase (APT) family kinase protein